MRFLYDYGIPDSIRPIVLSCFDLTTNMVKPWAKAGFLCHCIDINHDANRRASENIEVVKADLREWLPSSEIAERVVIAFFAPPCTDVAVSGARWFKEKGLGRLIDALMLFKNSVDIAEKCKAPYMIENPVSTVSTYWRKPDHKFQPWEYGDFYSKQTWLWSGNGFVMPKPIYGPRMFEEPVLEPIDERIWRMAPSEDRADRRSETPMGFADAVFDANYEAVIRNITHLVMEEA